MAGFLYDLRYSVRKLLGAPVYTTIAVGTLALAIGAATATLSVFHTVVMRPLPYRDPAPLAYVTSATQNEPDFLSSLDFLDYRAQSSSFADLQPYQTGNSATLLRAGQPAVRLEETRVGAGFFSLLGVSAVVGRVFAPGEDGPNSPNVALLSDRTWRSVFGGDSGVVGRPITLDGAPVTVVGVAPAEFSYPGDPDIWIPLVWSPEERSASSRGSHSLEAVGRLAPGVTWAGAQRDLQALARRLEREFPASNANTGAWVQPLQDRIVGPTGPALAVMLGAVGFVLLIACANVANLMLVREAGREAELAVRAALGAGRGRIVRQVVTESVLVSLLSAALGSVLAWKIVDAVVAFGPKGLPQLAQITVDAPVLLATVALALITGIVFGLIPAYHAGRVDVSRMLKQAARGSSQGGATRTRNALVVAEIALAVVLLVGSGLLLRSYERLTHVELGFRPDHLWTANISLPTSRYAYDRETLSFVNAVLARVRTLPGVEDAAVEAGRPIQADAPFAAVVTIHSLTGRAPDAPGHGPSTRVYSVSPTFFSTFRIPIIQGRAFSEAENRADGPQAVVVNQEFVRRYSPDRSPLGRYLVLGVKHEVSAGAGDTLRAGGQIVGVVADVKNGSLADAAAPTTYVAYGANPFGVSLTVRTARDPRAMEQAVRSEVLAVEPEAAVYDVTTMDAEVATSVSQPRFYVLLLGGFSAVALLIAALGIFGVVSYAVTLRTRELGIRVALGAAPADVLRLVLGNGLTLAAVGLALGTAGAAFLTREMRTLLFSITPLDPLSFAAACGVLLAVALAACWAPARRAAGIDPVLAMRAD